MKQGFNWFYALVIIFFFGMLFVSAKFFKGSANSSVGIASAKEYKINAEKSAVLKEVNVVPGQQVKSGDLLMILSSTELDIDIDRLSSKIDVMKAEQLAKSKMVESEIAYIRAEEGVEDEELLSDIAETESELKLNRSLTKTYVKDADSIGETSPLDVKIKSLQAQQRKHRQAMDIKIQDLRKKNEIDQTQLINQVRLSERELLLLKEEQKKLSKYAIADGVIGNVYIKEGEQVSAYTPLLSMTPVRPTTVIAYLVGTKTQEYEVGASVSVKAYGTADAPVKGKVIGYGSVSELPEILQKSTAVKAFGREIFIEISGDNNFANGQKVLIR